MTTKDAYEYRTYFPLMIKSWRKVFRNPDMPFDFVQLPKMAVRDPRDSKVTRESQMWTAQNLKNTGMVVTLDVGEPGLHPKTKRPIGERLANMALAEVYPSATLRTGGKAKALTEFTITGEDRIFVPANARIVGDTVVVSSPDVNKPIAMRYAWKNAPFVNLFGKNGLPAGPFRTDTFDLPEKNPPK